MKKILALSVVVFLLTGCSTKDSIDAPMKLRNQLCRSGCSFTADITADYGEEVYSFSMECNVNERGDLHFLVVAPETISGIAGNVTQKDGNLTFDDKVLAFPVISEGQLTPVSAPWHFIHTLRSGFIAGCGEDGEYTCVLLDDSYQDNAMHMDAWLNQEGNPVRGEILWKNRRVLTIELDNFKFL